MPRKTIACLALIATIVSGCASTPTCHEGELIAEYHPGEDASVTATPHEGTYSLYRHREMSEPDPPPKANAADPSNDRDGLRGMFRLPALGPIGFEKGDDGQLFTVVGEEKIPLPAGRYCWHAAPGPPLSAGQKVVLVLKKTGETVTEVVLVLVVVAVVIGVLGLYVVCMAHSGGG